MPPPEAIESPVQDSVPKVDNKIAVGENLEFQRRWWKFEGIVWSIFFVILLCDVFGLFGRGWLAKAHATTPDDALTLDYERIERASTPSIMTLSFGPAAIHQGEIHVYLSDSVVKPLGAQRISPQPVVSRVGDGGISYTFAASTAPASVQVALEPSFPGSHPFSVRVQGANGMESIDRNVVVLP